MEHIIRFLEGIEDKRQAWKTDFTLAEVLLIVLMATLCNADQIKTIAIWGQYHLEFLKKYLSYENGAPSHDTVGRVLALVSPEKFRELLSVWNAVLNQNEGRKLKKILALDGKTMRGNGGKGEDALHVLSAWS
jgi:hypothetical protein